MLSIAAIHAMVCLSLFVPLAATLSFNLSNLDGDQTRLSCSPNQKGICLQGDAFLKQGLQLTNNQLHTSLASSVGRAVYSQPVHIWDSATSRVTDFTTQFSFIIYDVDPRSPSGDGLAFFLSSYPSVIPENSAGGFLGLFPNSSHGSKHGKMLAIEFDTYPNGDLDSSSSEHIGINVNSIRSVKDLTLDGGIKRRTPVKARIDYNAHSHTLSVAIVYDHVALEGTSCLSHVMDLREVLPEYVSIGFSAATGSLVETHTILSWSFESNLDTRGSSTSICVVCLVLAALILAAIPLVCKLPAGYLLTWSWRNINMRELQNKCTYAVLPSDKNETEKDEDIADLVEAERVKETAGMKGVITGLDAMLAVGSAQAAKKGEDISKLDGMSKEEPGRNQAEVISSDSGLLTKEERQKDEGLRLDAESTRNDGQAMSGSEVIDQIIVPSNEKEGGTNYLDNVRPSVGRSVKEAGVSRVEDPARMNPLEIWSPKEIPYHFLVSATNNFSEEMMLGKGGFGPVYKGFLSDLALDVAIKKLSERSQQGLPEYVAEVKIITQLRHRNLVKLIGWCHENGEHMLVYEFVPNGSLDNHLFNESNMLEWSVRHKIVHGLASALMYLHHECDPYVLHRDIKSSNVLLDAKFDAKLADFGLARRFDLDVDRSLRVTHPAGTRGYWAPEYALMCKASRRSDVYSFGVVALEVACGKKAILVLMDGEEDGESFARLLVEWVWDQYSKGSILDAADKRLNGNFDILQMERLLMVGLWCAQPDPRKRPSMRQASNALLFPETTPLPDLPKAVVSWTYHLASMRMQTLQLSSMPASSPTLTSISDDSGPSHSGDKNLNTSPTPRAYPKPKRWLFPQFAWWTKRSKAISFVEVLDGDDAGSYKKLAFRLSTLRVATANFSDVNHLEDGQFGPVYRGVLPDGKEIAVKKLLSKYFVLRDTVECLRNEVVLLSKLQHRNLVRFLGFCEEGKHTMLVYEYATNGSLDKLIFDSFPKNKQLVWEIRYKIINGIAEGLQYLHEESQLKIIHRDVKPSCILLDAALNPQISNFGLANHFFEDQTHVSTRVAGTVGYIAPEYVMTGHVSKKSDVYSFGVLVLEMITGKRILFPFYNDESPDDLLLVWRHWTNGTAQEIIAPSLGGQYQRSEVMRCIQVALLCVQESPSDRPTMPSVVLMLSNPTVPLQVPSIPGWHAGRSQDDTDRLPTTNTHDESKSMSQLYPTDWTVFDE